MKDSYVIEKPSSDLNYLTIGIKYIVLFIVLFLASWVAMPLLVSKGRPYRMNFVAEFLFENVFIFSIIFSLSVLAWFIYRIKKKYAFGEVFKIDFNDSAKSLQVQTVNLANNQEKEANYNYEDLSFEFHEISDALFGKQRILHILNKNKKVHEINFDRTAWCRNDRIDALIEKIQTEHKMVK